MARLGMLLFLLLFPMFMVTAAEDGKLSFSELRLDSGSLELVEKGPPFRPGRHLKGIPIPKRPKLSDEPAERNVTAPVALAAVIPILRRNRGFTLIELVMVILLLAVLAAVAIPNFQDFRSDARNSAVRGAVGGVRSAVAIARAAIALKEDVNVPIYPTALEMQANAYTGSHPVLNALATANKRILDGASGVPANPWSLTTIPLTQQASVFDCAALTRPNIRSTAGATDFGWCYNQSTGEFWANSDRNSGAAGSTENNF